MTISPTKKQDGGVHSKRRNPKDLAPREHIKCPIRKDEGREKEDRWRDDGEVEPEHNKRRKIRRKEEEGKEGKEEEEEEIWGNSTGAALIRMINRNTPHWNLRTSDTKLPKTQLRLLALVSFVSASLPYLTPQRPIMCRETGSELPLPQSARRFQEGKVLCTVDVFPQ